MIKYDLALERSAYFYFENIDYYDYNTSVRSTSELREKDLIAGSRLPQNENEVVFSVRYLPEETELKDLLNQPIRLRFEVEDSARDAVIVGVFEGEGEIYVTDPVLERLQQPAITSVSSFSFTIPGAPPVERGLIIKPDATLSGKEAILKMVVGETRTIGPFTTDVNFSNLFLTRTLKDLNVTVRMEDYPEKEAGYGYLPHQILWVSEEEFANLDLNDIFQVSITPENPDKDLELARKIEEGPFYALALSDFQTNYGNVFSVVTEIFMVILVALLLVGIYFLAYISLKNIIYSEKQGFLVMRSLGIDGQKIRIQIFAQLLTLALITFLTMFIAWAIIRLRQRFFILQIFARLDLLHILTVGFIIFVLAVFLALRYSKRLLMSTIVAKNSPRRTPCLDYKKSISFIIKAKATKSMS